MEILLFIIALFAFFIFSKIIMGFLMLLGIVKNPYRKCPYCAERIKREAIVCKFCHKDVGVVKNVPVQTYKPTIKTEEFVRNDKEDYKEEPELSIKKSVYEDSFKKNESKLMYFVIIAIAVSFIIWQENNSTPKQISAENKVEETTLPKNSECVTDKDCPVNYSCRSKEGGGTSCKPQEYIAIDNIENLSEKTKEIEDKKPTPDPTDSNYIKVCNNGKLEGQGTCPKSPVLGSNPTDWACTKDKKTGLIWEVKTDDGGLRDKDWAYSWYESDDKKNGGFAGYKNGSSTVGSGGNCLTYVSCNTEDFTKEVNTQGLCGAKDWRMPTREELLTLLHCAKNQNTSPKTDGDFNRLCTDEALKDAPNINKNYFPNTESHFWTSTLTNSDAWVVVFSYGGANADNKIFDSPVRLVRGDKPKSSKKTEKKMIVKLGSSVDLTGTYYLKKFENCCFDGETKISNYDHLQLDNPIDVDLMGENPVKIVGVFSVTPITDTDVKNVDKVQLGSSENFPSSIKNGIRLKVHCDSLQIGLTGHYALPVYCANAKIYNTENCTFEAFDKKERKENSQYNGITGIEKDVSTFIVLNKSYFFDVPSTECKTNEFVIKNDVVQAMSIYDGYLHVNYENPKNGYKKVGWIKADSVKQLERKYKNNDFKITGGVGATAGGIKYYDVTCSENKVFSIMYDPFNETYEINPNEDFSFDFKSKSIDEIAEKLCKSNYS